MPEKLEQEMKQNWKPYPMQKCRFFS